MVIQDDIEERDKRLLEKLDDVFSALHRVNNELMTIRHRLDKKDVPDRLDKMQTTLDNMLDVLVDIADKK